jgi:predicted MPP superfamily phosphohydrolase
VNVYHKIVKVKPKDIKNPTKEIDAYLKQNPGIDYIVLQNTPAIDLLVFEFICSDNNPSLKRTMKDIDNLLMHLNVVKVLDTHSKDPLKKSNHLLQISGDNKEELERG